MNKIRRNITAGGGMCVLFLLQIITASGTMNFLFFPAVSLYLATYMTTPFAFIVGVFMGSIWDSISLAPFGMYALGLGGAMGGASLYMKLMDERNRAARGFAAILMWGAYALVLGIVYVLLGKETQVIMPHGYDSLMGFFVLLAVTSSHYIYKNYRG